MKNHIILTTFVCLFIGRECSAVNQGCNFASVKYPARATIRQDTPRFLKDNIISRKSGFIHKDLNTLLKQLHMEVKSYSYIHNSKPGQPLKGIILYFEDAEAKSEKLRRHHSIASLTVYFEQDIPQNEAWKRRYESHGAWLDGEKAFYGNMLVKDVTE